MRFLFLVSLLWMMLSSKAQPIEIIQDFSQLESRIAAKNDSIYVLNFWATWCKPCVEELPFFEQLHTKYQHKKIKVILVSLDFKSQLEQKLIPFIATNKIQSEVLLMTDTRYDTWLPKIDASWSGTIPATLVLHQPSNVRLFFQKAFADFEELENQIKPLIQP